VAACLAPSHLSALVCRPCRERSPAHPNDSAWRRQGEEVRLVREILGIADAEDLGRPVVSETPGRKGDGGHQGFEMTGRQIDDQPADLALAHRGQLGGDDLDMPIHRQLGLRIEVMEAVRDGGGQVLPQQGLVLDARQVPNHRIFCRAAAPSAAR